MEFGQFKSIVSKLSLKPLGGIKTQYELAPSIRKQPKKEFIQSQNPKIAAVLALFYPNKLNNTNLLLTKRASYKGIHSAQISFPGGKFEENDLTLKNTALRETEEEIGISLNNISIIKEMTNVFIPPSNFLVTPFLGYTNISPTFTKNNEVEEIIEVPIEDFLNKSSLSTTTLTTSYAKEMIVPCFKLNGYIVWGATAMMLNEIKDLFNKL